MDDEASTRDDRVAPAQTRGVTPVLHRGITEDGRELRAFVEPDGDLWRSYGPGWFGHCIARTPRAAALKVFSDAGYGSVLPIMEILAPGEPTRAELIAERDATREKHSRLRWGVVANAGRLSREQKPLWAHVMDATGNGSTVSAELCVTAGFDPDEMRGGVEGDEDSEGEGARVEEILSADEATLDAMLRAEGRDPSGVAERAQRSLDRSVKEGAALATARRDGAEAMRGLASQACRRIAEQASVATKGAAGPATSRFAGIHNGSELCAAAIDALPLPEAVA